MKKIVKYKFVGGDGLVDLEEKTNQYINEGWQPFGSVVILTIRGMDKISNGKVFPNDITVTQQPMVKYED